jgi:hypothetical protein
MPNITNINISKSHLSDCVLCQLIGMTLINVRGSSDYVESPWDMIRNMKDFAGLI